MDERTKELIAVGASVAAHCQPCLRHHIDQAAALGIGKDEIADAVAVGKMVQRGGLAAMRKFADALLDQMPDDQGSDKKAASEKKPKLKIYEPAMCCSTGVCGPNVDPRLVAFTGALKQAAAHGVAVERFNLGQEPQAFVENAQVKAHLAQEGPENLPFVYINGERVFSGRYPEAAELFAALGLPPGEAVPVSAPQGAVLMASVPDARDIAGGCCPEGECC